MRKTAEKLPHNISRLFIKLVLGIQILTEDMWQLKQTDLKANIKMDFFRHTVIIPHLVNLSSLWKVAFVWTCDVVLIKSNQDL